jgi:mannose-6-phosphate isomerase-like protein (cupin superfamily)
MEKFKLIKPSCNLQTVFDGRGGIFTWVPKDAIKEFNMLYFKPGASRGNHWHPEFVEYFLIVDGQGAMVAKDIQTKEKGVFHMSKGQCSRAEPGIAHAFHAITPVTAVAMLSKPWDECDKPIIHEDVTENLAKK